MLEMLQFDRADLNFGIFRIMNHRREAIESFIRDKLPTSVAAELDRDALFQESQAEAYLDEVLQQVKFVFGADSNDPH